MSGHSKWKTIKRQKGAEDAKRGAIFTKLSKAIIIAVKQGGGTTDPASNFRLRLAIDSAKASNMPKDTIDRAIEKGAGVGGGELQEVAYEGFAPHGVNVIVEAATDNSTRTGQEVKNVFTKAGGSFGQPGSSSYLFNKMGEIYVAKNTKTFDELFSLAVDSGAEDIEDLGDEAVVYVQTGELAKVRDELISKGLQVRDAKFTLKPISKISLPRQEQDRVIDFLSALEDLEDVQEVYSNLEVQ
ncbi:MAG TPA: YebC/PmpR family DNA-binding transcriptional regulator [Patescibacteria group bacterium]|nr:YebC/PmpR family DNA-binding transcriptional regulator [Patescibacteria group bacterium]